MTNIQQLEIELEAVEEMLKFLDEQTIEYKGKRVRVMYELNRARRLEREELQNGRAN